jgi:hypothetical protein
VLGGDNDFKSCKKCHTPWQSEDFKKGERLTKLTLTHPSKDGVSKPLLRITRPVDFWQNWREAFKAEQEAMARKAVALFAGEEIKEAIYSMYDLSWREKYEGFLFLTSHRAVFVMCESLSCSFIKGIRYEEMAFTARSKSDDEFGYSLKVTDQSGVNYLFRVNSEQELKFINEKIVELVKKSKIRIEQERKGQSVQVVLDFSFLKPLAEKGIILQVLNCPYCGGRIETLPSSGDTFDCSYCKNKIRAIDVFREINRLVDSTVECLY